MTTFPLDYDGSKASECASAGLLNLRCLLSRSRSSCQECQQDHCAGRRQDLETSAMPGRSAVFTRCGLKPSEEKCVRRRKKCLSAPVGPDGYSYLWRKTKRLREHSCCNILNHCFPARCVATAVLEQYLA